MRHGLHAMRSGEPVHQLVQGRPILPPRSLRAPTASKSVLLDLGRLQELVQGTTTRRQSSSRNMPAAPFVQALVTLLRNQPDEERLQTLQPICGESGTPTSVRARHPR